MLVCGEEGRRQVVSLPVGRLNSQDEPWGLDMRRVEGEVCLAVIERREGEVGCWVSCGRCKGFGLVSWSWPVAMVWLAGAQGVCWASENSRVRCVSGGRFLGFGRLGMVKRASVCGVISA